MPPIPFDANTVSLEETNLIEASAGTGKTYSIAILCLRLILEKNIAIPEILMVTFTKAAVAELETRIRLFVRLAHQASMGEEINDTTIEFIVNNSIQTIGATETETKLKNALLFLDETAILTIHSFCQRTLSEYAFETSQIFGADALSEIELSQLTIDGINNFWRKQIVTLETKLLKYLSPEYITRNKLQEYINNALGGKTLLALAPFDANILSIQKQNQLIIELTVQQDIIDAARQNARDYIEDNFVTLLAGINRYKKAQNKFLPVINNIDAIIDILYNNSTTDYIVKIFPDVLPLLIPVGTAVAVIDEKLKVFSNLLYQLAINTICNGIQLYKDKQSLLAFDDMINKLHHAVVTRANTALIDALKQKYKAVFIDEFQDTDKLQYEIFSAVFKTDTILFYIGDPKQSIYAWRKADILTYFRASNEVSNIYSMNTNYRSCDSIIAAQNKFFNPQPGFDAFYFNGAADAIEYTDVAAPPNNETGSLLLSGAAVTPITIFESQNEEQIIAAVVANVVDLLSNTEYKIATKDRLASIKPSDIGILVRSKDKGKKIRNELAKYKIPAVTIDDTKLSECEEAAELLYILQAAYDINASNINKALLSGITGYSIDDLLNANEELILNQFKQYQQSWIKEGVYVMLMQFITDYRVKSILLDSDNEGGERRLANILQLLELLHKIQIRNQYTPVELISWFQKLIEGKTNEGDEFELRIENDADAVKIVTIHSSKGLEYNIVIAPHLDSVPEIKDFASYRDDQTGEYLFANSEILNAVQTPQILLQLEQENRRLIYVAITRAKYKCFIYNSLSGKKKNSSLKPFIEAIKNTLPAEIEFDELPSYAYDYKYNSGVQPFPIAYKTADSFELDQVNWRKMSYTFLNPEHDIVTKNNSSKTEDVYSEFVFKQLKKGAYTGNLLHYIFECINFNDSSNWPKIIQQALKRLSVNTTEEYANNLLELLNQVMATTITCNNHSFTLSEINNEHCLNELEFDFTVQPFQTGLITQLSTPQVPLHAKSFEQIEGIMNGKMDLFFEKDGRYYILDWKSNFLGDQLTDYETPQVWAAMAENNYHLQYHIYTVAVCKYLALRIPDFDYEKHFGGVIYLFVRGVRKDGATGIFYNKPDKGVIEKIIKILSK